MLVLRKDHENYTRRAEAKLRLLSEVIQRVKNGESVDVERILGTGDETKEREWEEGQSYFIQAIKHVWNTYFLSLLSSPERN